MKLSKTNKKEADTSIAANPTVEIVKEVEPQQTEVKPIVKQEATKIPAPSVEVTFAIQIAASLKKIPLKSPIFKGIENVSEIRIGEYYKYYCFKTGTFTKTKQNLQSVKSKIPDAFMVAFKDDQPVSIKDALDYKK